MNDINRDFEKDLRLKGAKVKVYKTVDGTDLRIYMFGTSDEGKKPAIVFFHGGGWTGGSPAQFGEQCKLLASKGMAAFTAEYRVKEFHGVDPYECVKDARSAMRWVRSHSRGLGIDEERIAAGGGSAGGHLAACTAFINEYNHPDDDPDVSHLPQALVLFNPALDTAGERWKDRLGAEGKSISPVHNVANAPPPAVIFHGTDDATVPIEQAEKYAQIYQEKGAFCRLVPFQGKSHGFFNFNRDPEGAYKETMDSTQQFFADLGWITTNAELGTRKIYSSVEERNRR